MTMNNDSDSCRWLEYWDAMFQEDNEEQLLLTVPSEEDRLIMKATTMTESSSNSEQETQEMQQLQTDFENLLMALSCCGTFLPIFLWDEEGPVLAFDVFCGD